MGKRQQRKAARQGARDLRGRVGWDPKKMIRRQEPEEALRDLEQREQTESTYDAAESCPDCRSVREELGDQTALCERHLARALGK